VKAIAAAWLLAAFSAVAAPPAATAPYTTGGQCAGLPRLALTTPAGWCVALVANASQGLRFPRRVLEVAPGRFWLVDMGGWDPGRGRLLEFSFAPGQAQPAALRVLLERLDRPHGIARGPDGRIYIGEAGRIWRTPVADSVTPEVVIDALPADGSHPLKELVFAPDGRLLQPLRPWSTGLRNSLALAWVPTVGGGHLLQGENNVDDPDATQPPEELNLLRDGSQHGWPACVGARQPARGYAGRAGCAATQAPLALWPAHAAPLQMLAAPSTAPSPFAGRLLVAWHGPRATGHRIVSHALNAAGLPQGPPLSVVSDWAARAGVQPQGAPTGITLDSAGRLWIVEDRHRTLLVLLPDPTAQR
jgi:glucose/arabinose dehydrogenase